MLPLLRAIEWCNAVMSNKNHVRHTFARQVMAKHTLCAICDKVLRKVNGKWNRFKYEIREGGRHFLGNRAVKTKRTNHSRIWGCKTCYEKLDPVKVSHHLAPWHLCGFAVFSSADSLFGYRFVWRVAALILFL